MTEFGNLVRERVHEVEQQEPRRRKVGDGTKDNRIYKSFIVAMLYLCERNGGDEQLELRLKLYAWFLLSGLFFPRSVYTAA